MHLWPKRMPRRTSRDSLQWSMDIEKLHSQNEKLHQASCLSNRTSPFSSQVDIPLPIPAVQHAQAKASFYKVTGSNGWHGIRTHWSQFKKQIGSGASPSNSSIFGHGENLVEAHSDSEDEDDPKLEDGQVNQIVVDRSWSDNESSISQFDQGTNAVKFDALKRTCEDLVDRNMDVSSPRWNAWYSLDALRWRIWLGTVKFFCTNFADERLEHLYSQESWVLKKSLAIWASLWLVMNWILGVIFVPKTPFMYLLDKIFYFAIAPVLSIPITFMVIYDWPRDRPILYQLVLIVSIWIWSFYQIIFIIYCGFYSGHTGRCQDRDFLGTFYYTTSLQVIALFGLKLNRLPAAIGAICFFIFTTATIVPIAISWARNMINIFVFHAFLLYVHYMRERSERRLFKLRDRLRTQYKATREAQINERKAAESKRRLTSYVFHDKLNFTFIDILAAQYLEASGRISPEQELEFSALSGSLSMMSKVLNDVLDFHRLDSGKFETVSRPYAFHQIMRSLFIPLQLNTEARGLKLEANLDPNIDLVARQASYEALGETPDAIRKHLEEHPDVDGIVTGDETRLRQIVTNLTSNACKFTPHGGKLSISTRLILPVPLTESQSLDGQTATASAQTEGNMHRLSASRLTMHDMQQELAPSLERIVVRIEVTDTGCGIKASDLAHGRLFSAFNQTEEGKQQGGKGTGLGLALVRQIVKLSAGRLGVQSRQGVGSTFWVELPLGVGIKALNVQEQAYTPAKAIEPDVDMHTTFESRQCYFKNNLATTVDVAAFEATMPPTLMDSSHTLNTFQVSGKYSSNRLQYKLEEDPRVQTVKSVGPEPPSSPVAPTSAAKVDERSSSPTPVTVNAVDAKPGRHLDENPILEESRKPDPAAVERKTEGKPHVEQRPTYVPIPKQTFAFEPHPSSYSNRSAASSSLVEFDKNSTRASRSTSKPALNVEPGMHILVVDDDRLTRKMLEKILHLQGCRVSLAENGEVALRMILGQESSPLQTPVSDVESSLPILERKHAGKDLNEEKYALVFLDNHMPVLSGLKMVQKLRAMGRKDFVVGVTGNALLSDQMEYLEAGADRVLTKPVTMSSIQDILALASERRKREGGGDYKLSRKREREISLEPVHTPKAVDIDACGRETRTPAKKNRIQLDATEEEEDGASHSSSHSGSPPLGVSPPQEMKIKVRQISQGVEDMSWRNMKSQSPEKEPHATHDPGDEMPSQAPGNEEELDWIGRPVNGSDKLDEADETPPKSPADSQMSHSAPDISAGAKDHADATTSSSVAMPQHRMDPDSGDKGLKRKYVERGTSQGPQESSDLPKSPAEPTKRLRDDPDRDENPRETKRPSPPPEKAQPKPPSPKMVRKSGFEAYASTSSPFAAVKGQSVFSGKSSFGHTPSSQSAAAPVTSPVQTAKSLPSFTSSTQGKSSISASPPPKRSAFDLYASSASPFASAARSKSPALGSPSKLNRNKSPPRFTSNVNSSAFSVYAGGLQSFATPMPKRARAGSPNGSSNGKVQPALVHSVFDDGPDSGGSEDSDRAPTFGERLRAEKDDEEEGRSDEDTGKALLTKQSVTTGEEDEDTIHQVRGKLYALSGNQWKEKGTGTLKLNVKRSDGTGARLVMRKEAVYTLLLNVTLFHGMRCGLAQDPRYLRFSVIEDGATTHYNLRVPNAKIAQDLLDEIEANIPSA
ncbi:hypothetical protein AX17_005923 [Amanita inopinata Kibby_2008]|nr:hypothetical protein AX17_005923 [Amanita inopinata Kibby_2008]